MFPYLYIGPDLVVPTYFLVISFAYSFASYWLFERAPRFRLSQSYVVEICLLIMVMGFIGARLCHVIVEHPGYYMRAPFQILKFWQGGFVFYGGVLFALVGAIYYLRIKKQNIRAWMEMFTPVIISGYVIGRFATLLSGSGYGKPTDVPWAIIYPPGPEAPAGIPLHPTPIYSMLWNAVFLFYVMRVESRPVAQYQLTKKPGNLLLVYGIYHGVGRVLIEQFREDYRGELILGLSFSTWMSGALIVLCLFFLLKPTRSQKSAEGARP